MASSKKFVRLVLLAVAAPCAFAGCFRQLPDSACEIDPSIAACAPAIDDSSVDASTLDVTSGEEVDDDGLDDAGGDSLDSEGTGDAGGEDATSVDSTSPPEEAAVDSGALDAADSTIDVALDGAGDSAFDAAKDSPADTNICAPNATFCATATLEKCAADGKSASVLATCAASSTCSASLGRCTDCTPGAFDCAGAVRRSCTTTGTWTTAATCATAALCGMSTGGTCASPVCAVAEKTCSGKTARVCNADRTGWVDTACAIGCSTGACLRVTSISRGTASHVCAVLSDGSLRCWGSSSNGEGGTPPRQLKPQAIGSLANAVQVATKLGTTAVRLGDGKISWWGSIYVAGAWTTTASPVVVTGLTSTKSISVGASGICAIQPDTTLMCLGDGPFGDGTSSGFTTPKTVPGLVGVQDASMGGILRNTIALVAGEGRAFGYNDAGAFGDGFTTTRLTPEAVFTGAKAISAGFTHACAVMSSGVVRCSGLNSAPDYPGALGDGSTTDRTSPVDAVGISTAVDVSAGYQHSCALLADKTVRCWGKNDHGQLGDGTTTDRVAPVAVSGLTNVVAVSCGSTFTCALLGDGTMRCWGDNSEGQIGDGTGPAVDKRVTPTSPAW